MTTDDRLALSVTEVAKMLGLGRTSVYEAVRSKEIPSVRIGTRILIPKAAVEEMLLSVASLSGPATSVLDG
jgi:excisionase family DNA binding protein